MAERRSSIRNGLICAAVFAAFFGATWPIAEIGFNDDWSYIKCAQDFARTGKLVYDGWIQAMFGWQAVWGALFIHLLGFSFTSVRLSTLPLAMAVLFLFYVIQVRFGIRAGNAVIGTFTLGLSPLFLPLAASFMTDIPCLLVILLCLYCCQRATAACTDAASIGWLSLAALTNVAGGTVRQIAWLGALVMVPSTAWLLRKRHGVLLSALLLWIGTLACVFYCMRWFAAQPYAISEPIIKTPLLQAGEPFFVPILLVFRPIPGNFLCLLLLVFPVLVAWLPRLRDVRFADLFIAVPVLLLWLPLQIEAHFYLPWIPNLLTFEFSANEEFLSLDRSGFIFPVWACLIFSALIAIAFLLFATGVRRWLRTSGSLRRWVAHSSIFWLVVPYALSYFALLVLFAFNSGQLEDRYLLGLMPFSIIVLVRLYELCVAPRLPTHSVAMLALYSLLAIAGTHDCFAKERARLAAITELRVGGIPRNQIQGGYEYDGWTQVENGGHINDPRLKNPPGSYHAVFRELRVAPACRFGFASYTPDVHPRYKVGFPPMDCLTPSRFPPVKYRTWLPPFRRTVYVQQVGSEGPGMAQPGEQRATTQVRGLVLRGNRR
jgi:hypothetical protein